ncbi:MAG: DUF4097 family beta strand repeat-containing protein [Chloroflexota bacterium]
MKRPIVIALLVAALVFVLAGIGAVIFFTANGGFATNNPFDRRNISSELEESKTLKVDTGKPLTLKVADAAGDISITGADVESVQVQVVKTAYDSSQSRADEEVKGIKYTIEQNGNTITLKYEIPDSMNFSNNVNTVDFMVTVPAEVTVDVQTGGGEVNVSGTKGSVDIINSFGNIELENLSGALNVETQSGRVDASSIIAGNADIILNSGFGNIYLIKATGANVKLESNSGTLDVENVRASKDMELSSDFGNVKFKNGSAASLTISTNSGTVDLTSVNVSGALLVKDDFGDIHLEKVKAESYDTQTDSGSITIDGAQAKVKAHTGFGNITIRNAENAVLDLNTKSGAIDFEGSIGEGANSVHSDFGGIKLSIPADSALNVDFGTDFGSIRSDIPITVILSGNVDQSHQNGSINGGGSDFKVSTKSGDITVKVLGQ